MARRLPPLNALRAFEAAARHLSFTRAAGELNVTQAAISHQVKALESGLGVRLFLRLTRRLALTEDGAALFAAVGDAFERITTTADRLRAGGGTGRLTVSLGSYFSAAWLSPRIGRFWRRYPNIQLHLHHTMESADFRQSEIDLAVDWGWGGAQWPGLEAELFMRVRATPVCSPRLLDGPHPLRRPSDLRHHTLLHEADHMAWEQWLTAAGATDVDAETGPMIDDHNVLVHAAMEGQGVALAQASFIAGDIAAGRLARPFALAVDIDAAYYIVRPPGALDRPKVRAFRDWLVEEAAAHRAATADAA
jgi:LysR family glycine cleavage system transcriptional activator